MDEHIPISRRTWMATAAAAVLLAVTAWVLSNDWGGAARFALVTDLWQNAVFAAAALFASVLVARLRSGEGSRAAWRLIVAGLWAYVAGDVVWTVQELGIGGTPPVPSASDICYFLYYTLTGAGILHAASAFRGLYDLRSRLATASAATICFGAAMYFTFLEEVLFDPALALAERAVYAGYVFGDVVLLFGPAVLIILVVSRSGLSVLAVPWQVLAAACVVYAFSDGIYSWLSVEGLYHSGHWVDLGWMLASLMMSLSVSVAVDVARPPRQPLRAMHAAA